MKIRSKLVAAAVAGALSATVLPVIAGTLGTFTSGPDGFDTKSIVILGDTLHARVRRHDSRLRHRFHRHERDRRGDRGELRAAAGQQRGQHRNRKERAGRGVIAMARTA